MWWWGGVFWLQQWTIFKGLNKPYWFSTWILSCTLVAKQKHTYYALRCKHPVFSCKKLWQRHLETIKSYHQCLFMCNDGWCVVFSIAYLDQVAVRIKALHGLKQWKYFGDVCYRMHFYRKSPFFIKDTWTNCIKIAKRIWNNPQQNFKEWWIDQEIITIRINCQEQNKKLHICCFQLKMKSK